MLRGFTLHWVDLPDELLDGAVNGVRFVIPNPRLCLQSAVLLARVLDVVAPAHGFVLKVGSLHVIPDDRDSPPGPAMFDPRQEPRGDDGSLPPDAGFHVWLEHRDGTLLDPSILLTLTQDGHEVGGNGYFTSEGRTVRYPRHWFVYEALPELEIIGQGDSEAHLARAVRLALQGPSRDINHGTLGPNVLDVRWRR